MTVACQDVAHGIVSIRISSGTIRCAEQLSLIVIGIRHHTVTIGIGGDVAHAVVGVTVGNVIPGGVDSKGRNLPGGCGIRGFAVGVGSSNKGVPVVLRYLFVDLAIASIDASGK